MRQQVFVEVITWGAQGQAQRCLRCGHDHSLRYGQSDLRSNLVLYGICDQDDCPCQKLHTGGRGPAADGRDPGRPEGM